MNCCIIIAGRDGGGGIGLTDRKEPSDVIHRENIDISLAPVHIPPPPSPPPPSR